jgi:hypothetical protein
VKWESYQPLVAPEALNAPTARNPVRAGDDPDLMEETEVGEAMMETAREEEGDPGNPGDTGDTATTVRSRELLSFLIVEVSVPPGVVSPSSVTEITPRR